MAKSRPYIWTSEVLDELQAFVSPGEIILQEGDLETLDLPHLLSARQLSDQGEESPGTVLWLDGANSFNPYRIARIARSGGKTPDEVLESVYISRAFTCYQMSSLVLEKSSGAIEKHDPQLLIITGIPSLFYHSDIPRDEAEKALDPLLEALPDLALETEMLLMTSRPDGEVERSEIFSKTESAADVVVKPVAGSRKVDIELKRKSSNNHREISLTRSRPETKPLESYVGGR
ncbi:hypothetical protein AKJ65_06730 [candidate division MSBL1 archaeon SCGC-AAA259E19]|uniref:Rad51-like C-terminal domain-containing protein n=1 Tax=candidate division MSBL1 archaeon SCGC-AAA259E19 TaxID=1698264 RepID=A0A133UFT4_9EURY|nr:hypothetical protein AKJ65_06730 [candidate division MSBL1 archaeon SCGC-AAA259E19]